MKNKCLSVLSALILLLVFNACKQNSKNSDPISNEETSSKVEVETLITENEDQYPRDLDLFGENSVKQRIKALTGEDFDEIVENFETETPIVSEENIYKFTGCRAHECPGFMTKIYYDANRDNFNVLISRYGKVKIYDEKGKISVPKVLEVK